MSLCGKNKFCPNLCGMSAVEIEIFNRLLYFDVRAFPWSHRSES